MKKLICALLALAMCASMAACGGEPAETTNSSNEQTASTTTIKADTTTKAPTTTDAPATTQAPVTTATKALVTTKAPETTTTQAPVTTKAPETTTTKAPVTTKAPETTTTKAPVTEPTPAECSHNYKVGATKDATCTAKGSKTYTCSKCGDTYSEEIAMIAHNYADATCTAPKTCKVCKATEGSATGHNYTDATCTEPKTCKVCGATECSALGHSYSDGACTRCGEADPNAPKVTYTMDVLFNENPYEYDGEIGPFEKNGKVDYDVIVRYYLWNLLDSTYRSLDDYYHYIVPEDEFIAEIKAHFELSDAEIKELKAASPYGTICDSEHYYENGFFHINSVPVGGESMYYHKMIGYTDQSGVLTTYIDYTTSGYDPDDESGEPVHLFYYAVEYHYTGTSDLRVYFDGWYDGQIVSNNKSLIDSLKIASVKKVDSLPSNITPVKTPTTVEYTAYFTLVKPWFDVTVKVYDSDPTVGIYDKQSYHLDDCTKFKVNGNTLTCECGAVSFTDDEPYRSEENGYE